MIDGEAVARLRDTVLAGGLALVPTDTVYGLAAALDSPPGIDALYALKGRDRSQPCQVLLYSAACLDEAAAPLDEPTRRAVYALLPGPATCVVADPAGRYAAAGGAAGTVGLRAPRVAGALAGLDVALVATSANDPGGADPSTLADVPARIRRGVAEELDGGRLPGIPSAVVDLRSPGVAVVIRPGADPGGLERRLRTAGLAVRDAG